MKWKRLLASLLFMSAAVCASGQTSPHSITVDESRCRIQSTGAVITAVLALENSAAETSAHVRAELLDPSDAVRASGEIDARLHPGTNQISVAISGWTQKPDEWNETIFYRVRYRVAPSQKSVVPVEGILALAAKSDGVFDIRVVAARQTMPGRPFRVRVYARSLSTLQPMAGVQISSQLESDNEDANLKLTSITNSHGYAQMEFKVPAVAWGSSATLKVVARKGQVVREASDNVDFVGHLHFFTTTDKPLYQPGQTVHLRTLLQDWTRHAVGKAPVTFAIQDEEDTVAFTETAETSRFGVARADWEIPENLRVGEYKVKVAGGADDTDDEVGWQSIRISRYELPTFTVNVAHDRGYYLPGQTAAVTVTADYLFGKPVTHGHVKVSRETERRWNFKEQRWDTEEKNKWEGDTDAAGKFTASIDLSGDQDDLHGYYGRFRDLDFAAYFTDPSTKKTEQRRFRLRISRDPIHVYVIEAGNSVGQLPLEFYVSASYADGSPAQCEIGIYQGLQDDDKPGAFLRSVKTNRYGVAKIRGLNLPPLPLSTSNARTTSRLVLEAHDKEARGGRETQDFWQSTEHLAIQVTTSHALYHPSDPVDVEIYTNHKDASLLLDVLHEGRVIESQTVSVRNGHAFVVLPYQPDFQGEVTIAAYAPLASDNRYDTPMGTRTIVYPHDPALKVTAKFDHATYHPGEDAVVDLHVRTSSGAPAPAALGSVIFDQAVEERARTDAEFGNDRGYGFDGSFGNYWYEAAEFGGLKREDLDHLDVTQPFSDDMQLAAEALLLNRWGQTPMVFGGADYPEGIAPAFRNLIEKEVAPIKAALDAAYDPGMAYPQDLESMRHLLAEHGVDFDKVLDPWGQPFRAKFYYQQIFAEFDLVSAGPDKKFDTEDDVPAVNVPRWYFRPVAEAVKKAMSEYHARTSGYIRDFETLKTELAKKGMQWAALRDPWGQPYVPQFGTLGTRFKMTVTSGGPDGKLEPGPNTDDFLVWTDFSDYFSETAVKIDAALARSFAATQKFPQDEDEFYKVLDNAQIEHSLLVDAWGRRARLVFDSEARYADRVVMDYSEVEDHTGQVAIKVEPETTEHAFIHLYSAGQDGIVNSPDDFQMAVFSREISRQNSTMLAPLRTPESVPLSGGSGAISGAVTDPSGAVVAGTKVSAELDDRIPFETKSDASGHYELRNLPTGLYSVTAEARGFRNTIVNRVPVKSLSTTELNLKLDVGMVNEVVEVTSESIMSIQTSSAEVSSVSSRASPHTEGAISTPRLRNFFPETLLWEPMLETDSHGNSRLHFKFADSITNWKLSLVASTIDGQIGLLDTGVKTFQSFFMEHEPPSVLTQGDEIALPVVLRNYLEKPQTLHVEMKPENWFTPFSPAFQDASVAAGESERAVFRFRVTGSTGEVKQRVTAANHETGDAVEKKLSIHPDGEPRSVTSSHLFSEQGDFDVEVPDYAMPGSVRAELKLYPNPMSHVIESSRTLLERPYGCGEQTISSTYPNVMILRLYKQAEKPHDSVYRTALHFAEQGYARLLSYQHDDGGISVWKNDPTDLALTAYALRFLNDVSEFVPVDPEAVVSAQQFLLHQQSVEGSWLEKSKRDTASLTAYVALALAKSRKLKAQNEPQVKGSLALDPALNRALDYLRNNWSASNDPYAIAQVALAAFQAGDKALGIQASGKLRALIHSEGDTSYWALESNTLFYGWGTPGRVETTALVVQALAIAAGEGGVVNSQNGALAERGLLFLIASKDAMGAWYSGQTTINVLDAFLLLGQRPMNSKYGASLAEIKINGARVTSLKMPGTFDVAGPLRLDLGKYVKPGRNHISISRAGESQPASAQAVVNYYIPWDQSSANASSGARTGDSDGLALRVHYDRTQVQPDQEIRCSVHAERIGFRGYGMMLTEIGLPPGAVVDRASLEKAMSGDPWNISQYELQPDRLVVYLWPKAGGTDFEFTFRPRYGMNAWTAPSSLYDYYNPQARVVVRPTRFEVESDVQDKVQ